MISSTKLVPELQHYMNVLVNRANLNKDLVYAPVDIEEILLDENKSFVRLLFDENWPLYYTSYRYLFQLLDRSAYPYVVSSRLMLYPQSGQYYVANSDTPTPDYVNVFNLQSDDLMMLDVLLEYRLDSTSVTLVSIDYNTLTTSLSKLIYIYLDVKIYGDYSLYDNTTLISDPSDILSNCFEFYLVEIIFNLITSRGR